MKRIVAALAVLAAIAACAVLAMQGGTGCWHAQPTARAPVVPADPLAGDWQGRWESKSCNMGGALRAEIRKQPAGTYLADFHAQFAKVMGHDASVALTVHKAEDKWVFEGAKDLGFMAGGVYTYKGHVASGEFFSTYDSTFDKGEFRMTRAPASQPATSAATSSTEP